MRLAQSQETTKSKFYDALVESIMFTICREIFVGSASKHSKKFHFQYFTDFLETIKDCLKHESSWSTTYLDELFIRINMFASRQYGFGDILLFFVAHAKLSRKLKGKLE